MTANKSDQKSTLLESIANMSEAMSNEVALIHEQMSSLEDENLELKDKVDMLSTDNHTVMNRIAEMSSAFVEVDSRLKVIEKNMGVNR